MHEVMMKCWCVVRLPEEGCRERKVARDSTVKSGYDSTNSIVGVLDGKISLHVKT